MTFFRDLGRFGPAIALVDPQKGPLSYAQLAAQAREWRVRLGLCAPNPDSPLLIGIEIAAHSDMIAAYLGALQGGHAVILAAPGSLLPDQRIAATYRPDVTLRWTGDSCSVTTAAGRMPCAIHPDLRLLLSTSGSTGDPRLVRLSEENITSNAASIADYLGLRPADTGITSLPLHYSYGMSVLHSHLAVGARLVLTDLSLADPAFDNLCRAERVSNLALVPHQFDLLSARGFDFAALPSLRFVTQAGGRLAAEKVQALAKTAARQGWAFVVMYGQTEAAPRMAYLPPDDTLHHADTIGRAIPGGQLTLLAEDGSEISGTGEQGELVYHGPNVMMGYADSRADLARGRELDCLHTGDIAERTEAGYFRLRGRAKRFVKLYGLRINLDQIDRGLEAAGLGGHAVGVDDHLVVMTDRPGQIQQIRTWVATDCNLPEPDILVAAMPDVPRLANGKTDMQAITARARDALAQQAAQKSDRPTSGLMQDFAQATRRRHLTPSDSFARIGGDSLAYLHVMLAIEARLGHVPARWEEMSIATLEGLAPGTGAKPRRLALAPVEGAVLTRLIAVGCVVLFHLNHWPVAGGTWLLILLAGHSLARFQREHLGRGAVWDVARNLLWPVLPLYFVITIVYAVLRGDVPVEMYLLNANNVRDRLPQLLAPYWFISLYAQLALAVVLVGLWPMLQRRLARTPFSFGLIATLLTAAVAALFQYLLVDCNGQDCETAARGLPILERTLPLCLPFLCAGWTMQCARTGGQKLQAALALGLAVAAFPIRETGFLLMMVAGAGLLLLPVTLYLPLALARLMRRMAAATLFVYLTHNVVVWLFRFATPFYDQLGPVLSALVGLPMCFALAMLADSLFRGTEGLVLRLLQRKGQMRRQGN